MPEAFDAYHKWLGIPPSEQPPNRYRLLGIAVFESDPDVIATAADKQMAHIRSFQTGQHSSFSQKILNEIAAARICLLSAAKKANYDVELRGQLAAAKSQLQPAAAFDPSQLGFGLAAAKSPPVARQSRKPRAKKLPWQLTAGIIAAILASGAIIAYLIAFNSTDSGDQGIQARAGTPAHVAGTSTKPKENVPSEPEPIPGPKSTKAGPKSEPLKSTPDARSEPKPEPKPGTKPESKIEPKPLADSPEKVAERVKDGFRKARTAVDFRNVAIDALKLIAQANTGGKHDVAKSLVVLALAAARKADDDELAKVATMCVLAPGAKRAVTGKPSFDIREAATADQRKPLLTVPDAAAQEQAMKLVQEVFNEEYSATTSDKQKALAQELIEKAQNSDAAARYVMLREAGRFAIKAKDAVLALYVVEEMETRFDVDAFDLNMKALTSIGKSLGPSEPSDAIVNSLLALMEEATTKEKFDAAKQLGTTAIDVARKSRDLAFIKETAARQGTILKEMAEIQKAQADAIAALDALGKNPIDPTANLVLGKYRCFLQGNWNKGVSMLALGDDPALKKLALKELNGVTDATEQASLGDAWRDLGEKKNGLAKKNIQDHAASWYQQALPGLTGLLEEKVEKRLVPRIALRWHLRPGLVGEYFAGDKFNRPIQARIDSRPAHRLG